MVISKNWCASSNRVRCLKRQARRWWISATQDSWSRLPTRCRRARSSSLKARCARPTLRSENGRKLTRTPFQEALRRILNAPWEAMKEQGHEPLLAPPVYGCWQAAVHTVEITPQPPVPGQPSGSAPAPQWLHELNLDPRHRSVSALGTQVVQTQQEQLMASAWGPARRDRARQSAAAPGAACPPRSTRSITRNILTASPQRCC